jgi:hypothetical protein
MAYPINILPPRKITMLTNVTVAERVNHHAKKGAGKKVMRKINK